MNQPTPIVIIVGFLGAGKTTFLRNLLPLVEARGLEPFVIINDYANARVDASSLRQEGRLVTPINGNCICCDSLAELMDLLLEIPPTERRLVLVEANGTTDPTVLIEHVLGNAELRERFAPLLQVAVVDLERWQKRHWHDDLERLQVETASHILFTREETTLSERFSEVQDDIAGFNPRVQWIKLESFALELDQLVQQSRAYPLSEPAENACAPREAARRHGHSHDCHELSHAFVGMELRLPDPMSGFDLQRWLKLLPREVLRVKGVVRLSEEPDRWFQFQRVDDLRGEAKLYALPQRPLVPACAVLIGVKLNEQTIRDTLISATREETDYAE